MSESVNTAQITESDEGFEGSNIHLIDVAKALPKSLSDKEVLEDIINSWNLDEPLNSDGLEEASPEVQMDTYLWIVRKKEEELVKHQKLAAETIERTERWLANKEKNIVSTIEYLSNRFRYYLKSNNLKSLSLPNGIIGLRKRPKKVEVVDEELFFQNANPSMLTHHPENYEPDLNAIKSHIKDTSELPKGVEIISQENKFYYKLSE
jgi:hypothetical protein